MIRAIRNNERRSIPGYSFLVKLIPLVIILAILLSSILAAAFQPTFPPQGESSLSALAQPLDDIPPSIQILVPVEGQVLTDLTVHVVWEAEDLDSGVNHTFLRLDSGNWINVDGLSSFDANLLQGGNHNITIAVFDVAGNQARVHVDFVVHVAPDAPDSLNATAGTSGIAISWAVPYDGGSPIISYKVFRRFGAMDYNSSPLASPSFPSYLDANMIAGTKYFYEIVASNAQGDGPPSSEINATLAAGPRPPDAPVDLTSKAGAGFVSLSWSAPADQGGAAIMAYRVYRTSVRGANPTTPIATVSNGLHYYIDSGLVSGEYRYKVSAVNFAEGPRSNESSANVSGIQPGSPGTIVSLSLLESDNKIALKWQPPVEGATSITRYLVYRSAVPYDPVFLNFSTSTTIVDGNVSSGQTFHYWIAAENAQGQGPLSAMLSGTAQSNNPGIGGGTILILAAAILAILAASVVVLVRLRK